MSTCSLQTPASLLETTLNTRDLGVYFSQSHRKPLKAWRILRSDVQYHPSDRDVELLQHQHIETIIDMRGEKEVLSKPSGFSGRTGFTYIHTPIDEGSGIPASVDAVSASYMNIAESRNMAQVFKAIAAATSGVMFNCTAGKDRTGVVSAILLGLCGVSEEDIVSDYMLTKVCNQARFDLIRQHYPDVDMNIVIPHERYMKEFLSMLYAGYGSYRGYLLAIGVHADEIDRITAMLL